MALVMVRASVCVSGCTSIFVVIAVIGVMSESVKISTRAFTIEWVNSSVKPCAHMLVRIHIPHMCNSY